MHRVFPQVTALRSRVINHVVRILDSTEIRQGYITNDSKIIANNYNENRYSKFVFGQKNYCNVLLTLHRPGWILVCADPKVQTQT